MPIQRIDHVNVRTTQLDAMIHWYTNVLEMRSGPRPDFSFPGAWMYVGESPVVHLVGISGEPGAGSETSLKLEHFAFAASGNAEAFEARMRTISENYKRNVVPSVGLVQINVWDPDGNHIHIDFSADG